MRIWKRRDKAIFMLRQESTQTHVRENTQNDSKKDIRQEKIAMIVGDKFTLLFKFDLASSEELRRRALVHPLHCNALSQLDLSALGHLNKDENKCRFWS